MRELWKAGAFLKLGLLTDISYRLSFAFQVVDILLGIAAFYFLARLLGEKTPQGYASFPFILVGMAVNGYMTTSMVCFAQGIRGDQLMGTLKAMLATRTSPLALILLSSLYPLVRAAVDAGLYLLGGMLFGLSLAQVNITAALLFFLVSLIAFSSIGIFSATFTLVFKRGDPLLWLFGSLSWLLGGVFYPLEVLPPFLQRIAQLLPITHALEGMRAALLHGTAVIELLPQIETLALFGLVGLPISLIAFSLGVRRARVTGTLSHY
jgi:ABC-2 type transport system permease protein